MPHNRHWSGRHFSDAGSPFGDDGVKDAIECFICVEPCRAICVFSCGHYACYSCGLRIHASGEGSCPVCRVQSNEVILTRVISQDEDHYSAQEIDVIRGKGLRNERLKCIIDGDALAAEMEKLYENLCPIKGCWTNGEQEPFVEFSFLKEHLAIEHKMSYCEICLQSRPVFLCEQMVYGEAALRQHMNGICPSDSPSFIGHPVCRFCTHQRRETRLYDGEALLKHMQEHHYTCDICNRGQFTFTFYENRQKLDHHFVQCHKVCEHPDCNTLDLMLRVFPDDFELMLHKKRTHGVKGKVTFTPSTFGALLGPGEDHSPLGGAASQSTGGNRTGASTGSNTNASQITFDHVFRKESVELLPAKSNSRAKHGFHGRGHNPKNGGKDCVLNPVGSGLPLHFHHPKVLEVLQWPTDRVHNESSPEHISPNQRDQTGVDDFNCAFSMPGSVDAYLQRNKIPLDPAERAQRLDELVRQHLTSPVDYASFRGLMRSFAESKIYAIEYYDSLANIIFPKTEVFNEIFPLLVSTVANPTKKRALCEIWKIKMAPELQRRARAHEQDEREAKKKEEEKRVAELWNSISGGVTAAKRAQKHQPTKKNAWLNSDIKSKLASATDRMGNSNDATDVLHSDRSITAALREQAEKSAIPLAGGATWSSQTPAVPSTTSEVPNAFEDALKSQSLYPSLPCNEVHHSKGKGKKQPQRPNAWFKK